MGIRNRLNYLFLMGDCCGFGGMILQRLKGDDVYGLDFFWLEMFV